jgi:formate hydrogenlyase transcriptional activator
METRNDLGRPLPTGPLYSGKMSTADSSQRSAERLESRLEFETLISDLSSRFINLPAGEVDSAIEDAQRRICEFLDVDRSVLWQWSSAAPAVLTPTHIYFAQEGPRSAEPLRQELFPWVRQQLLAGRMVVLSSLEELPAEAAVDRENARRFGIKSNLTLPLVVGGEPPVGVLAFNTLRAQRDWPEALVKRLQLVAQVFTSALLRSRHELRRQESEEVLRAGNEHLAAAADLAGLAFYEVDFDESLIFIDDRFRHVCGIPPEREQGLQPVEFWMEHMHPDDRQRVLDLRQEMDEGKLEQLNVEYRYLHPTHGEKWIHHLSRVTRRDATGRMVKAYGVLRDITERRRREEALRQSHAEIERLKDRLQAESDYLKAEIKVVHPHGEVTGQSPAIQEVLRLVEQVAPTDSSVLVRGETGSGKELVAQAVHRLSPRRSHLLVKVNCAALPSGLVESELFGREKGAFTGALTRQIGRFEVADGSTLFLDEIGELSLEVQAKLLRVLETGEFERLGSPKTIKVNVRLIAATHRDLAEDIRKGRFREDLYYRLNVFPIRVPPLRERAEDIPLLVWTFLEEFSSRMGKTITQVPRKTMVALQRYPWPGNVRELRNVIEHGAILTTGETLRVPMLDDAAPVGAPPPTLADSERELILRALETTGWRIKGPKGAAAALGLHPSTLYNRMKKLGIRPPGQAEDGSA